jgi:hypothetical protein
VAHEKLAELNKAIAERAGTDGPISQSCMAGHLGLDGQGWLIPHDVIPDSEYLPEFAMKLVRGMRLVPRTDENGNRMPRRLIQVGFNRQDDKFIMAAEFQATLEKNGGTAQ